VELDINPVSGAELQALVAEIVATPAPLAARRAAAGRSSSSTQCRCVVITPRKRVIQQSQHWRRGATSALAPFGCGVLGRRFRGR
jgi:hypothetical protein